MIGKQEHGATLDAALAGGAITMPLWAAELNFWLHLFMAIGGSILIAYRIWILIKKSYNGD